MPSLVSGSYLNGSVSQNVAKFPVQLGGVFVSSATGATIALFDDSGTATSVTIVGAFTPNTSICWYPIPVQTKNGLNVSVTGTITYTIAFG